MSKKTNLHGVSTKIRYEQGAKHKKPHIHATYCEYEASIDLSGTLLAGKLPCKKLKSTIRWIRANKHNLRSEWRKKNSLTN